MTMTGIKLELIVFTSLIFGIFLIITMIYQIRAGIYAKNIYNLLIEINRKKQNEEKINKKSQSIEGYNPDSKFSKEIQDISKTLKSNLE